MPRLPRGIFRRDGRARYYGRYVDGEGVKRQVALDTTLDVSIAMLAKLSHESYLQRKGLGDIVSQSRLLRELADSYLEELPKRAGKVYVKDRRRDLKVVLPLLGVNRVGDLRAAHMERAREVVLGSGIARRSVNDRMGTVMNMLRWAEKTGRIARNPVIGFDALKIHPKDITKKRRRMTPPEVLALIDAARAEDERLASPGRVPQAPMLEAVAWTGFRWSSAAQLRWCDFDRKVVEVEGRKVESWWLRAQAENEKNGREVVNPIPSELAKRLLSLRGEVGRVFGSLPGDSDPIFLTANGRPWKPRINQRNALRWLRRILAQTDLPEVFPDGSTIDWHALRHTLGTLVAEATNSATMTMLMLGHSSERTSHGYTDLSRLDKLAALNAIQARLSADRVRDSDADRKRNG